MEINSQGEQLATRKPDPLGKAEERYHSVDIRIELNQLSKRFSDQPHDERVGLLLPEVSNDRLTSNYVTKILYQTYSDDRDVNSLDSGSQHDPSNSYKVKHKACAQIRGMTLSVPGDSF